MIGREVEAIVGLRPESGKGWQVTAQVLELARIPNSTDVLARYEVTLDSHGELTAYERTGRFTRSQSIGGGDGGG